MFPVGGVEVMLLGVAISGLLAVVAVLLLRPRLGWMSAVVIAALAWSVVVLGLITLLPTDGSPGIVPAETRAESCSWDIGGPAPEGFWIFSGGQRMLNAAVFAPSGTLLVLAAARWPRWSWATVPLGLGALAAYSVAIELTQLALARLDRACDVTDIIDNVTGAVAGVLVGIVLAVVLRPWRHR